MKTIAMRLWSLHPRYLDTVGLVACWREGLLARAVLSGTTVGYRNHPQLVRFILATKPLVSLDTYLQGILAESRHRGYCFDAAKIGTMEESLRLTVTGGQLEYEFDHLKRKLKIRSPEYYARLIDIIVVEPHPLFAVGIGGIAPWEKL